MEQLKKALVEVTGGEVHKRNVKKYFYKAYSYLLYQDADSLFETLDYRQSLGQQERKREQYLVFRYMLRLIKIKHPKQFSKLCPVTS